jgi:uncharacterized protein (DUF4415 family)
MKKNASGTSPDEMPADVSHRKGWRRTARGADLTQVKVPTKRITINLDQDIIAIFKAEALLGGPPYQTAINQALRHHLRERETASRERAVETVLTALDDQRVRRKLRRIR